jgi:anti-anti-sigma factor
MTDMSRVLVGPIKAGFIVKVIGRGTMEFCSQLFDFLSSKFAENSGIQIDTIYFDLSESTYLDSSFIGVIVHIDKKIKKINPSASVIILNPTQKVEEILNTMGLMEILPVQKDFCISGVEVSEEIHKKIEKDYNDIKLILESHQNLMELNSENRKKFGLVEEMLKQELERNKNE